MVMFLIETLGVCFDKYKEVMEVIEGESTVLVIAVLLAVGGDIWNTYLKTKAK